MKAMVPNPEISSFILDSIQDVAICLDQHGEITQANRAASETFGGKDSAPDNVLLWPFDDESRSVLKDALEETASSVDALSFDLHTERKNKKELKYRCKMRRMADAEEGRHLCLVLTDVTEKTDVQERLRTTRDELAKSREQLLRAQKLEAIGRLAGGIAHDFNNLLTSIISFTRFVKADLAVDDPRQADLTEVLKAADSAAKLTSQLLAFSRRRQIEPTTVELNRRLRQIDRMLRRTLGPSVELVILTEEDPLCVLFDPGQLEQVVFNLAVNGRDAMPEGGALTIECRRSSRRAEDGSLVEEAQLRVSDTGTGIKEEHIEQIFEPFFSTKGEGGTGLGLATCYGIVAQAEGRVDVESQVGRGTTFTVCLPAVDATEELKGPPPALTERRTRSHEGRAMIVEDQPAILSMVRRTLEHEGFNVVQARTAEEALALVEDGFPDLTLLVSDVVLPGLSGVELVNRIRSKKPSLPVVLTSGYMGEAGELPQDDRTVFVPKPFSGQELAGAVIRLVNTCQAPVAVV